MADDKGPQWPVSFMDACHVVANLNEQNNELMGKILDLESKLHHMLSPTAKAQLRSMLDTHYNQASDYCNTRQEFKEVLESIDEIADRFNVRIWDDNRKAVEVGLQWWDSRCPDCGTDNAKRGDHPCPTPGGDPS